jgi:molybdenum cofactor synthesis domain-containing protein
VIGDEILSGRTKDKNIGYIAEYLTAVGIDLREVRIVPDDEDEIVTAVRVLSGRYTYLFTTGGIGPTHDDITADAVSTALGITLGIGVWTGFNVLMLDQWFGAAAGEKRMAEQLVAAYGPLDGDVDSR